VGQRETERLNEIIFEAALASAICTAAELGVADHIRRGSPRSARQLAEATGTLEGPLYRLMRMEQGLSERCEVLEGSFFETIPAGADAYLFRHILHDWTDEQCLQILSHCRNVIPARGRLLVFECIVPPGNARSISKDFDITMMNLPGGLERTEAQFRELFARAGFELSSITPTATMVSIAEAHPISR